MNQQQFLQRYQFSVRTDRLGGGTFGTVYKAYDTTRDRYVAIKVAEVKTVNDKTFSLEDELKAVSGLPEHRNLAHYESVWQFESPAGIFDYAVMQYYPAGNLRQLLDKGQLSAQQRRDIAAGLLRGLAHLHQHKVIHRDLKPSNILIAQVGQQYIPKIADFGLSKRVSEGSRFTNSLAGGTLAYSAPEQLLGKPLRLNADLWSAGVLLFELFLGYRPFRTEGIEGSSAARDRELFDQIVNAPLPPETAQIPAPFAEAVAAFLVKSPEERARRVLPHWTGEEALGVEDTDEGTHVEETLTDTREAPPPEQPQPPPTPAPAPSRKWLPLLFGALAAAAVVSGVVWWLQLKPAKLTLQPKQDTSGQWGYVDDEGAYVLPAVYDSAGAFEEGLARVVQGDSLLVIGTDGAVETVLRPDNPGPEKEPETGPTAEDIELSAWQKAEDAGDIAAYEGYLSAFPSGLHASEARRRLEELRKPVLPAAIQALERNMVRVSGGSFTMGCTSEQSDCDDDESPAHRVELSSFSIGKYEVTQGQWEAVMGTSVANQRDKANKDWPLRGVGSNYPVYYVSWDEVQDFIDKLNRMTGGNYRLPTEAEWEYAARGGSRSRGHKYSGSDNLGSAGWYDDNSGSKTHPVGQKTPNELGLYDMSGNVWEWCSDWYDKDYYSSSPARNPKGSGGGSFRVFRGGSWNFGARYCRVSNRRIISPDGRYDNLGFRLAAP